MPGFEQACQIPSQMQRDYQEVGVAPPLCFTSIAIMKPVFHECPNACVISEFIEKDEPKGKTHQRFSAV